MVLTPRNFSTRIVINENAPPALTKVKALSTVVAPTLQESTRRRRRRVSGSTMMRAAALAQQTQRRRDAAAARSATGRTAITTPAPQTETTPAAATTSAPAANTFKSVRTLRRPAPNPRAVRRNLVISGPEYDQLPYQYVLDTLSLFSERMLDTLEQLRPNHPPSGPFPTHVEIQMPENGIAPSHVLALHTPQQVAGTRPRITLFPIHNQMLTAHCANLPPLPNLPLQPVDSTSSTKSLKIPVVDFPLPYPEQFSVLQKYLYTKDTTALLTQLLGSVPPPALLAQMNPATLNPATVRSISKQLGKSMPEHYLEEAQMTLAKFWRNAYVLNVHDNEMWHATQLAWTVLAEARGCASLAA